MRIRGLREVFLVSSALIALGTAAEAQFVTTVATVPGTILDSDGARIFYTPTANPNAPTLFDIATNTNTVVCNSCSVTNGFVTPTGAIFVTNDYSGAIQLYNGAQRTLTSRGFHLGLGTTGTYAFYDDGTTYNYNVVNTATGDIVTSVPNYWELEQGGLTAQGTFAASTPKGPRTTTNVYYFDGTNYTAVTHEWTTNPTISSGATQAMTDGTSFLYLHWGPGYSGSTWYELIHNNPSSGEVSTLAEYHGYYTPKILSDYQISNGWVAYRTSSGNLVLLSPSGASSDFGQIDGIVKLGSDGSVAYAKTGVLYLRDASGGTSTIGGGYSNAFQVGTQWYFIGGGQLSAINSLVTQLNGAFNATSGTFNAADGTILLGTSDFTTSRPIAMAGATTVYTGPYTVELSGVVSGPGSLTKMDLGTLILSGNNTYTGGTRINAGALQIGNGGTTGSVAGDIVNNGSLRFNRSDTYIYAGTISGTGYVMQTGSGTTILTGTNTYRDTLITAGTLQIGNGGTTGSVAGNVYNDGALVFDRSDTYTFAGTIFGAGPVKQIGSGTVILNGFNSYGGGTTVAAGSLMVGDASHAGAQVWGDVVVAAGAKLFGYGSITGRVANSGTVAPGGSIGTLTVGSFAQAPGGRLEIEVAPTAVSRLHVNGAASLGGTVALDFQDGAYGTRSYMVLNSSAVSGTFASVTAKNAPSGKFYGIQYTPDAVSLVIAPKRDAQIYSDFQRNSFDAAQRLNAMAFSHVETQYCTETDAAGGRSRETECTEISFWMQPFGGAGAYRDAGGLDDYSARWAGVMGGFDFHTDMGFALNVATAYARNSLSLSGGLARVTTDTFCFAMDAGLPLLDGRLDINGHWMLNNGDATRAVNPDTGGSLTATSKPKNTMFGGAVQYAHPIFTEDLTAAARLTYTRSQISAFHESGAQPFDLAIDATSDSSLYSDLRLRFGHVFQMKSGALFIPEISGGVRAIIGDAAFGANASLFEAPLAATAIPSSTQDRFAFVASVGFKAQKSGHFSLYTRADTRISNHAQEGQITAGAAIDF